MLALQDTDLNVFFQASYIEATFPDGSISFNSSEDVHVEKRPNRRNVLVFQQENDTKHVVRLYLIPPEQDWRSSANFTWALATGMMRNPIYEEDAGTEGWLYWNKENYVQSQIQAFTCKELLSVDSLTIQFAPMDRFPWAKQNQKWPSLTSKIVIKNLLLGAHLEQQEPTARQRPCSRTGPCEIVDGVVVDGPATMSSTAPSFFSKGTPLLIFVVAAVFVVLIKFLQRKLRVQDYSPVETEANGEDLQVEGLENVSE